MQAILAAPMGVIRLMDMMTDMEALRNEVLLLLIGLTHSNQSIQQIAAFEGAFERLLSIIRSAYPFNSNQVPLVLASLPCVHKGFLARRQLAFCGRGFSVALFVLFALYSRMCW